MYLCEYLCFLKVIFTSSLYSIFWKSYFLSGKKNKEYLSDHNFLWWLLFKLLDLTKNFFSNKPLSWMRFWYRLTSWRSQLFMAGGGGGHRAIYNGRDYGRFFEISISKISLILIDFLIVMCWFAGYRWLIVLHLIVYYIEEKIWLEDNKHWCLSIARKRGVKSRNFCFCAEVIFHRKNINFNSYEPMFQYFVFMFYIGTNGFSFLRLSECSTTLLWLLT